LPPEQLLTLWIGPNLSELERACLRSALICGHRIALYCYAPPVGVPAGVELRDAAEILPESAVIRHRGGSPALFSNHFRYELLARGLGIWIDCDAYFVAPLPPLGDTIMGEQGHGKIATGVLRLPSDSPILKTLRELFAQRSVPPWLPWRSRLAARARLLATGRTGLERMPWGSAGPDALTWLAREAGVAHRAQPPPVFYPVHWTDAAWICDPARPLASVLSPETVAVHLWNERLRTVDLQSAPAGSFAARLLAEGAA
jgi:hypothetical protein